MRQPAGPSPFSDVPPEEPPQDQGGTGRAKPSPLRNTVEWVVIIIGAMLVALIVKTFLVQAFYIPSGSMLPTLQENDRVLVNKLSYDLHDVRRGDIVVFRSPNEGEGGVRDLIKRVIALPGETVESRDGRILIDGKLLEEPYLGPDVVTGPLEAQKVPPNGYWVMGDNRPNSRDSRFFGPIDESLIVGRAFVRVWPIGHIRFF
jgi:signal peptidase I